MSTSRVLFDVDGPVAFLTVNRPEASNAMTLGDVRGAGRRLRARRRRREPSACFVLRGAGGKAFISGTDISQFTGFSTRRGRARLRAPPRRGDRSARARAGGDHRAGRGRRRRRRLRHRARLRPARLHAGRRASACRSRARSATACRRRTTRGCVDLVGPARVKDLMFTGRLIDADEAHAIGLVTAMVDAASSRCRGSPRPRRRPSPRTPR